MNRFRELRIRAGYHSQSDLAKELFVNQTAVSQWERGVTTPSPPILIKLANLYGVTTDYLLGTTDSSEISVPTVSDSDTISEDDIKAAFWGGDKDLSQDDQDAMWDDVKRFAAFLAQQKKQEKQND